MSQSDSRHNDVAWHRSCEFQTVNHETGILSEIVRNQAAISKHRVSDTYTHGFAQAKEALCQQNL
jgi:hypothetical protein